MDPGSTGPFRVEARGSRPRRDPRTAVIVRIDDEQELDVDLDRLADLATGVLNALALCGARVDVTVVAVDRMTELNRAHMGSDGATDVLAFPMDGADHLDRRVGLQKAADGTLAPVHTWDGPVLIAGCGTAILEGRDVVVYPQPEGSEVFLGDLVLCPSHAAEHAAGAGHTLAEELDLLTVHGLLHLLGHDHALPAERDEMFALTDLLLRRARPTGGTSR